MFCTVTTKMFSCKINKSVLKSTGVFVSTVSHVMESNKITTVTIKKGKTRLHKIDTYQKM